MTTAPITSVADDRRANTPVVKVDDLWVSFPTSIGFRPVVRGMSLTIGRDERVAVVGESGSGKTMLGLTMLGIQPHHAQVQGRVEVDGVDVLQASEPVMRRLRGGRISMVFQEPLTSLNPVRTIGKQLMESVRRHSGHSKSAAEQAVLLAMASVGIPAPEERLKVYPHQLSGGLRQRVMIALALVNRPSIVVADEPTTALDATIQAQILDVLRTGLSEASLMLITHDLAVAAEVCDRVIVVYAGNIVEEGPVEEILSRPRHPYTRGLLAAVPRFDPSRPSLRPIPGGPPALTERTSGCRFAPRCSFADDKSREAEPPLKDGVACWHPQEGPVR